MRSTTHLLVWDFDGTLAYREGGMWSAVLLEVLRQQAPEFTVRAERIQPHLQAGFPWQSPHQPHPEIQTAEEWWDRLVPIFVQAFRSLGFNISRARSFACQVRHVYTDPQRWRLFDNVLPTLEELTTQGWTHVVLSNHVPELPGIIEHLGLLPHFARVSNSAETGYEKPHPQSFQMVLDAFPDTTVVWVIGDSLTADISGAGALGIPAILVHRSGKDTAHVCNRISEVPTIVSQGQ